MRVDDDGLDFSEWLDGIDWIRPLPLRRGGPLCRGCGDDLEPTSPLDRCEPCMVESREATDPLDIGDDDGAAWAYRLIAREATL